MKQFTLSALTVLCLIGCSKEPGDTPRAETSVKIDVGEHKDALEKNLDKASREIKAGANEAKEKLADAGEAIKDKFEEAKDKLDGDKKAKIEVEVKKD